MPMNNTSTIADGTNPLDMFLGIGLEEKTARNTIANNKVTNNLVVVIHEAGLVDGCDRTVGNLLYTVAMKFPSNALVHRPKLLAYIVSLKIKTPAQLEAAFSFFSSIGTEEYIMAEFEKACGVGIEVSSEEIEQIVNEVLEEHKNLILEKRYRTNVGELFAHVRERQRWADPKIVKQAIETKLVELLGERTAADDEKPVKKKKEKPIKVEDQNVTVVSPAQPIEEELNPFSIFPSPEENIKVVITNLEAGHVTDVDAKRWPDAPSDGPNAFYKVPFSRVLYIERSDFRLKDSKDYYGLAPGKSALLKYAFPIKCTDVIKGDDNETVLEIRAEYDKEKKKHKGVLHWVAEPSAGISPLKVEVRLFETLFLSENPANLGDDWLSDLNPHSKSVIRDAYAVPSLRNASVGDSFQFERLGFFVVDKDSTPDKLVFNRTVTLRDSYGGKGSI
ncbi:Glutamine--tRNA ligase-like protein [Drosera capensis]